MHRPDAGTRHILIGNSPGNHKGMLARQTIRNTGAQLLSLSPLSPDLNPVEMALPKLKTRFRKAAETLKPR